MDTSCSANRPCAASAAAPTCRPLLRRRDLSRLPLLISGSGLRISGCPRPRALAPGYITYDFLERARALNIEQTEIQAFHDGLPQYDDGTYVAVLGWDLGSPASSTSKTKTIGATASSGFSAGKTAAHTWCWATHGAFGLHTLGLKLKMNIGALPLNEPVSLPKNGCPHVIVGDPWCFCIPWVHCCKRTTVL